MRELPKYALLTNSEISGLKIISLEYPYLIASVFEHKRSDERVSEHLEVMAQERYPIAKVKGCTVFLTVFTSLEPNDNREFQQAILNDMARWYLNERVLPNPGKYMKCEETGSVEQKIVMRGRVMRERKNRIKKD
jgi:hypothetical protein